METTIMDYDIGVVYWGSPVSELLRSLARGSDRRRPSSWPVQVGSVEQTALKHVPRLKFWYASG